MLDKTLNIIVTSLFAGLVLLTLAQVGSRYLGIPIQGADEIIRYLFIWLVFLGIAYGMGAKIHISVDFLDGKIPPKIKYFINILNHLLMLFYASILVYEGIKVTQMMHLQFSPVSRIPMSYIFSAIPIGGALLFIYLVLNMVSAIKEKGVE